MSLRDNSPDWLQIRAKAAELGGAESHGINWIWYEGFPTEQAAIDFEAFVLDQGCETRGVYHMKESHTWDVRCRTP